MSIKEVLSEVGLGRKESEVYLSLLENGESTATQIAKATVIDRTLIYQICDKLIEKGMASVKLKDNTKHFSASDPDFLVSYLESKKERLDSILPLLKEKQTSNVEETSVELYKGRKGIYSTLKLLIENNDPYYFIGGVSEACEYLPVENASTCNEAAEKGIPGKILVRRKDDFFIGENEIFRYMPSELYSSTTMILTGDKTIIYVWSKPYHAVVINNGDVTKGNKSYFDYIWRISEEPTQEELEYRRQKLRDFSKLN